MNGAVLAKSGEAAKAGPIGLAVILLLCIACYFLFKSMSKHLREVRENFPTGAAPPAAPQPAGPLPAIPLATTPLPATAPDTQRAELLKAEPPTAQPALPPAEDVEPDSTPG